MKAVISIANVAARSGKTTVAVNLAAEFAARGWRTLLVDADPQARATPFFMKPDEVVRTLSDVLLPVTRRVTRHPASAWDVFSPSDFPHLGVVAGDIRLAAFEGMESARLTDLRDRLELISGFHDVAILDTPSSLALLTRVCLRASTHVIVPVSPDTQGEEGLRLVAEFLGNMSCGDAPPGLWVVSNRLDCRDRSSGLLDERLRAGWSGMVFDTIIHRDDLIESCAERGRTVTNFAPQSPAADSYARLTNEVLVKLSIALTGEETIAEWVL
jgi:chromosome partitioning protein